jgi:glycosyltransferase involved in cell wall biosynthesis
VVLSDVGGAAEMIVPGWNGLLFPVGDTQDYVNRLLQLSDNASARRMGRHARAMIELKFSAETMTDRYEQLLVELCKNPAVVMAPASGL